MYLEKNTHRIYYKDVGDKNKPSIIFIHGFPLDHSMWEKNMSYFQADYRTISYDVRGLGKSTLSDIPHTFEFLVDDLFDLMNHLGIDKTILCGLSMGGYIALRALERKPDKFIKLILCDTQARAESNQSLLGRHQNIRVISEQGMDVFAEKFANNLLSHHTRETKPPVADAFRNMVKSQSVQGIAATLIALGTRTDTTETLGKIKVPVLFMGGEYDSVTSPQTMKEMADRVTGSILNIIPNVGHMSAMENPDEFNSLAGAFLKSKY